MKCRLASDNEAERRIWKMTTRTKPDRGELLYQAPFHLQNVNDIDYSNRMMGGDNDDNDHNWCTVRVPFKSFMMVRGPRVIPDGPPLNVSTGLYQIGMTMSKFILGVNTTELENFRDGYFDFHVREIGLYYEPSSSVKNDDGGHENTKSDVEAPSSQRISPPKVLTKEEAKKKRSVVVKVLLPLSKLFFSETR